MCDHDVFAGNGDVDPNVVKRAMTMTPARPFDDDPHFLDAPELALRAAASFESGGDDRISRRVRNTTSMAAMLLLHPMMRRRTGRASVAAGDTVDSSASSGEQLCTVPSERASTDTARPELTQPFFRPPVST
ncbi:MAG: hypothetical protein U0Q12_03035 [Vicinamibacterales bacterium]